MPSLRRIRKLSPRRVSVSASPPAVFAPPSISTLRAWCEAMEKAANAFALGMAALAERAMDIADAAKAREAGGLH